MTAPQSDSPKLDKPGAGIPLLERLYGRFIYMPKETKRKSWEQFVAKFRKEGEIILKLVAPLTPEQMERKVLINRITGIEDSSRFWSVAMTMEHLMIVATAMTDGIVMLSKGQTPPFKVDTAKVKPQEKLSGAQATQSFKAFLDATERRLLSDVADRDSCTKLKHPWFGQMTARQWTWLNGAHFGIHRRQVELIIKSLT